MNGPFKVVSASVCFIAHRGGKFFARIVEKPMLVLMITAAVLASLMLEALLVAFDLLDR